MNTKRFLSSVLCLFFCLQLFSQVICSYNYRKRITFDPTKVMGPSDLTNFPVLINIASDNDLRHTGSSGHVESTSGFDIVFTASDGITLLTFQMEKYTSTNGQYTAWVLIPNLSTSINTDIYMYYGSTTFTTNQSSSNVWTNYHGVWHLENSSFVDNSPSGNNVTNNGTTNQSPAFINDGRANNGTQWLEVSSSFPNLTTDFTMSGWMYSGNVGTAGQRMFCDDVNNTGGYALSLGDPGSGALRFFSRSSNPVSLDTPNNTITNNTWYFLTAVADITNKIKRIYVNGVQVASGSYLNNWGTDNGNCSIAGETAAGETGNRLNGRIDEVHVAKSVLSADWLLTEYNNQSSPSTFYSISVEPAVWDGSTNTNWTTNANWASGSAPSSGDDIILPNVTNQPNYNTSGQIASLWVRTGVTLSFGNNRVLSVTYDITNCGTINGGTGSSAINLNSTSSNVQEQNISGAGTYNLTNLTINNTYSSNPTIVLNKDVSVSGNLTLTSGIVNTTATNILALGTGATSTSGSASSFISGPISKAGTANFVFPTGKGTKWRRAAVTNISASSTYRAEYFDAAFTNTAPVNSPLNNISKLEYWQIDRTVGTGNANVSLYWENAGQSVINDCPDLTIARWNGASWDERAGSTVGGSTCSGTGTGTITTTAVVTAFSPFTFGSKSAGVNPLPITLLEFKATCISNTILLNWKTASENNNNYFIVERSLDGEKWMEFDRKKGAGNSSSVKDYSANDTFKNNDVVYYRLTQVDFDGHKQSFEVIANTCNNTNNNMLIYPNPTDSQLNIQFELDQNYNEVQLIIIDALGKIVFEKNIHLQKGKSNFQLEHNLDVGVYTLLCKGNNFSLPAKKIVIKD
ncbi:DUF2341 domain-containing protein [Aurantibacillus circumpalustris]|uniref:DUF2341 domain-containing protein n=1 Tax=Aurantibacillus circumpalustris TaxID=3036359 RepID=UPI00295AC62A|nr:DUF2341 domain-containing protein [Aurantibacillus circumpalustris]